MRHLRLPALLILSVLCGIVPARAADRPIVAELFTSQGCSSCPAAEALLGKLATRPELLPLAMHIDYWDQLGWKDPFASHAATARQRAYAAELQLKSVYTPQMIVDGHWQAVGSDPREIADAIAQAVQSQRTVPMRLIVLPGMALVTIAQGDANDAATVWLVGFDRLHETAIEAGENAGRTLTQANVVRGIAPIGAFGGRATEIDAPIAWRSDRLAVLLQQPNGLIIGAAVADAAP